MPKLPFSKNGRLGKNAKLVAVGLIVGLVLGVCGTVFLQNWNPKDEEPIDQASVVFSRIVQQNKLVSASQDYTIVEKATDSNKLFDFIEIPFTNNGFWYRYSGTIEAAVNLETADYARSGEAVTITLDQPFINSNSPDMEVSGVLEEQNNLLNPIHVEDVDRFQKQCIEKSQEQALAGGILDDARKNAESDLTRIFTAALGDDYTIAFVWRDATDTEAASE